jgi:Uma2 family endonuclease
MSQATALTLEAVLELPLERREFLNGELFVAPAPEPSHQDAVGNIYVAIKTHLWNIGQGRVFFAPLDVIMGGEATQPDVIYIAPEQLEIIQEKRIIGAPIWLVDVVSPTSHKRDFETKRDFYLEHGVQEYWVVSPEGRVIWVYTLEHREGQVFGSGTLSPRALPNLNLEVARVFQN